MSQTVVTQDPECEQGYADRAEQQRLADIANAQAAATQAEREREAVQAEFSPDNHCREPTFAGNLIDEFNGFDSFKDNGIKAVDIEHLTTVEWDDALKRFSCHGVFVLTNGGHIAGSISVRPNVAGNMISTWTPD